ncbi:MFS transporter [Salinibacterium hongtaonis]|uniref:MFS transporter n=1 Tax=Homoserinimonas hongtaonis TaxID=2079791 RepID=A0A2U1SWK5_9MICO|nr:MFS transporter [Salinibacterium hongtaonis]AWB88605.1 hypothetical protein C2138_02735 [Salinibacterium hongtaonis]PWB96015.1 MFS transporter [Salinibacterium hongtaonis]
MKGVAETGTRGAAFWLVVIAATVGNIVNTSNNPVIAQVIGNDLEGNDALAGFLVSLSAFASIAAMLIAGAAIDRFGVRPVLVASTTIAVVGLVLVAIALTVPTLGASRVIVGGGNAAVAMALTSWIVAEVPHHERGKALGFFGLSVWVGLALGPTIGDALYRELGQQAVWIVSALLQTIALAITFVTRAPRPNGHHPVVNADRESTDTGEVQIDAAPIRGLAGWIAVLREVALPGTVTIAAWACEAFMVAFLIQHLAKQGVASGGIFGAANVFIVFAASVIITRLAFGGLTDKLGPVVVARWALAMVAAGMVTLGLSNSFALAALGAVLVGVGYSPLYPALTILATENLDPRRRSTGLGIFSALTSFGHALGSLIGGYLILVIGEGWTFTALAGVVLLSILLLRGRTSTSAALR